MSKLDDLKAELIDDVQDAMTEYNAKHERSFNQSTITFGNSLISEINECDTMDEIEDCRQRVEEFVDAA